MRHAPTVGRPGGRPPVASAARPVGGWGVSRIDDVTVPSFGGGPDVVVPAGAVTVPAGPVSAALVPAGPDSAVRASVAEPDQATRSEEQADVTPARPWIAVVWNDPVNLMSYVTYVFESYFGYARPKAEQLMLQVHHEGRAVVSHGDRERIEVDVQAMHSYGLWATMQRGEAS